MRRHTRKRRWTIAGLALVLLAGMVLTIPGIALAKTIDFEFTFLHPDGTTTTISGTSEDNTAFLPDAGGTTWPDGSGMDIHVSCSDEFPGGWGEKDGPDPILDSAWQVLSYTIFKDGKLECTTVPPPPPPEPDIDIEKATNGFDADDPTGPEIRVGGDVEWTYVVTNTGDVDLYDNVVTDDVIGQIGVIPFLAPGASQTLTAFGTAEEGQYENWSTVVGTARIPLSVSSVASNPEGKYYAFSFEDVNSDDTLFIQGPITTNDQFFANLGGTSQDDPIGMTMHLSCSDPFTDGWGVKQGPDPIRDSAFRVDAFWIFEVKRDGEVKTKCGAPFPVEQQVSDDDPSHYIGMPGDPDIDIEKYTNGEDADEAPGPSIPVGGTVTWTYVVTNTGDVPLWGAQVRDDIEGWVGFEWKLEPGESVTFELEGTARPGQYENEACVVANTDPGGTGEDVDDCDPSHYLPPGDPAVDIEKLTNGYDADEPPGPTLRVGDPVTWTYIVTNTGDVDLENLDVTDDIEGDVGFIGFLAVGESTTLTKTGFAVLGQYANLGCVVGYSAEDGTMVEDCDPSHYDPPGDPAYPEPGIDLEKATNGHDADLPGGPEITVGEAVTWTYQLTNTGDQMLYGIYLFDEKEGRVDCPASRLAPGDTMTCTFHGIAAEGQYMNVAWVDAWGEDGTYVSDEDPSHYFGVTDGYERPAEGISLEFFTNDRDADRAASAPTLAAGSSLRWTYQLTNTGEQMLYGIYLHHEGQGQVTCPSKRLAPGDTMTCTLDGHAGSGLVGELAWVDAWGEDGAYVSDDDPSWHFGVYSSHT